MMVVPGVGGTISASRIQWSWLCWPQQQLQRRRRQGKSHHASSRFSLQHERGNPSTDRDSSGETVVGQNWAFFEHSTLLGYIVQDYDGYGNRIRKQHELVRAEPGENKENAKLYLRITTTPFERTAHNWVTLVSALVCTFGHPGVWWPQQFHRRCHDPRGLHQLRYRLSGCSGTQCHLVASKALRDCL